MFKPPTSHYRYCPFPLCPFWSVQGLFCCRQQFPRYPLKQEWSNNEHDYDLQLELQTTMFTKHKWVNDAWYIWHNLLNAGFPNHSTLQWSHCLGHGKPVTFFFSSGWLVNPIRGFAQDTWKNKRSSQNDGLYIYIYIVNSGKSHKSP